MATKDFSRTVIEGGRARFNCWERRRSHRVVRARERMALAGGGDWDGVVIARRTPVWRAFADKLAPAERYLAAQVGRPWSKVRSELFARFDTRTTAGRLGARRIGRRGGALFWFVPTAHERLRQGARLSAEENAHWSALPDWFRQEQELRFAEEG